MEVVPNYGGERNESISMINKNREYYFRVLVKLNENKSNIDCYWFQALGNLMYGFETDYVLSIEDIAMLYKLVFS